METLEDKIRVRVRFSELDAIGVVWHGNYVKYMEDAREAFGRRYGIGYKVISENGYFAPVYEMQLRYVRPAVLDDCLTVLIRYRRTRGAKMIFDYEIRRDSDGELMLEASTVQLFTTKDGVLELSEPEFYRRWKRKMIPDFYSANQEGRDGEEHVFKVSFNPDCEIYQGHFPGSPVSPGVCLMEMVEECAETVLSAPMKIGTVKKCRFLKVISPGTLPEAEVRVGLTALEDGRYTLKGRIVSGDDEYMSITCELLPG